MGSEMCIRDRLRRPLRRSTSEIMDLSWRSIISLVDLLRGLLSRSNIGLPGAKRNAQCNSSLVSRPNVMVTVAIILNQLEA